MLVTFLFWNVFRRPLETRIARIAAAHAVDVIMLAECETESNAVLTALNGSRSPIYNIAFDPSQSKKIKVFTRLPEASLVAQFNDILDRVSIWRLRLPDTLDMFVCIVHLVSKANFSDRDQTLLATEIVKDINLMEAKTGSDRFIVVGDFNMNPFDDGMIAAQGFHAVMTKQQAQGKERTVQGRHYQYFYNPMWGHFGDRTDGPAGTYYHSGSQPLQYFWNIYDQVLLRPALMNKLTGLEILTTDSIKPLLTAKKLPRKSDGSDHLPVLFRLDL